MVIGAGGDCPMGCTHFDRKNKDEGRRLETARVSPEKGMPRREKKPANGHVGQKTKAGQLASGNPAALFNEVTWAMGLCAVRRTVRTQNVMKAK